MWRRIIEKLYDTNDCEILTQRAQAIIDQKKAYPARIVNSQGKVAVEYALSMLHGSKKLTRDELLKTMKTNAQGQQKLLYVELVMTVMDF